MVKEQFAELEQTLVVHKGVHLRSLSFLIRVLHVNGSALFLHRLLHWTQKVLQLLLLGEDEIELLVEPVKKSYSENYCLATSTIGTLIISINVLWNAMSC